MTDKEKYEKARQAWEAASKKALDPNLDRPELEKRYGIFPEKKQEYYVNKYRQER
jgi:hypothetical protein